MAFRFSKYFLKRPCEKYLRFANKNWEEDIFVSFNVIKKSMGKRRFLLRFYTLLALFLIGFFVLLSNAYAQVNIEKFREMELNQGISGYVEFDLFSKSGNVKETKINLENRIDYVWNTMHTFLIIRGDFGWEGGKQYSNEAVMHLRHIFRTGTNMQPEIFAQLDYNKERRLSFRSLIGGGLRFAMYKSEKSKLWWGTAIMQEQEHLDLDESNSLKEIDTLVRWSNYLSINVAFNEQILLSWTTYFQPYVGDFENIRILSEKNLLIRLSELFSLTIAFRMRYDNQPPIAVESLDTALKTGLVLHF